MALVRQLMVRAGADFSQMREEMHRAQGAIQGFKLNVLGAMKGIAAALATLGIGAALRDATREAMNFEASIMQINRTLGGSAGAFDQWAKENASALGLARSEAIKYGATYSNIISTFEKDSARLTKNTQELIKASAITAAATGRTMEDTMERIRSGMLGNTEAIEDLGIFVGVSMIESTEAFRRFAGDKSWLQLDFQTQQQIRLFAILEQAAAKYGTEVANNTISKQQRFTAELKNARLALGQAFLPIYNIVLPALTRLAQALAGAINVVAQFSQALFGKASETNAQAKATQAQAGAVSDLGDAYTDAGKAAAKASKGVASFDETNQLSDTSGGAGAAGGIGAALGGAIASSDVGGFAAQALEISDKIKRMADNMKKAISELANDPNVVKLVTSYGDMKKSFNELSTAISDFFNTPAVKSFGEWIAKTLGTRFVQARTSDMTILSGIFQSWAGTFQILEGFVTLDFGKILGGVKTWAQGIGKEFEGLVGILFPNLIDNIKGWWTRTKTATAEKWDEIKETISTKWQNIKTDIAWFSLGDVIKNAWTGIKNAAKTEWESIKTTVSTVWETFKTAIGWDSLKTKVSTVWTDIKEGVGGSWNAIKQAVSDKWNEIVALDFSGVYTGLIGIWNTLKTETGSIWTGIGETIKGAVNGVIDLINKFVGSVNKIKIEIPSVKLPGGAELGGFSIGMPQIPKIPRLARGGVVDGKTNMGNYIAGEAGAEMIVPLENTSFTDKIAAALGTAVMTAMTMNQGNGKGDTIIQLNGVELARAIHPYMTGENTRLGGAMITTT